MCEIYVSESGVKKRFTRNESQMADWAKDQTVRTNAFFNARGEGPRNEVQYHTESVDVVMFVEKYSIDRYGIQTFVGYKKFAPGVQKAPWGTKGKVCGTVKAGRHTLSRKFFGEFGMDDTITVSQEIVNEWVEKTLKNLENKIEADINTPHNFAMAIRGA